MASIKQIHTARLASHPDRQYSSIHFDFQQDPCPLFPSPTIPKGVFHLSPRLFMRFDFAIAAQSEVQQDAAEDNKAEQQPAGETPALYGKILREQQGMNATRSFSFAAADPQRERIALAETTTLGAGRERRSTTSIYILSENTCEILHFFPILNPHTRLTLSQSNPQPLCGMSFSPCGEKLAVLVETPAPPAASSNGLYRSCGRRSRRYLPFGLALDIQRAS